MIPFPVPPGLLLESLLAVRDEYGGRLGHGRLGPWPTPGTYLTAVRRRGGRPAAEVLTSAPRPGGRPVTTKSAYNRLAYTRPD
jgi:hypothetical protein